MPAQANYLARHALLRRIGERNRAQLAELVAEGYSVAAAARSMGLSQQSGSKIWRQIRDEMGEE